MHPIASRLRPALLAPAFIGALALSGVIAQGPRGGATDAVPTGFVQGWPIKYLPVGKLHLEDISLGAITDQTR
jgi:hypothetical protein